MSVGVQRAIGGAFGFAFAAVWVGSGLTSAVVCAVAAGFGYAAVRLRERTSVGGVAVARDAVRRELHGRLASKPRAVRSTRPAPRPRHPQPARRPVREPAAPAVADTATYGW